MLLQAQCDKITFNAFCQLQLQTRTAVYLAYVNCVYLLITKRLNIVFQIYSIALEHLDSRLPRYARECLNCRMLNFYSTVSKSGWQTVF